MKVVVASENGDAFATVSEAELAALRSFGVQRTRAMLIVVA